MAEGEAPAAPPAAEKPAPPAAEKPSTPDFTEHIFTALCVCSFPLVVLVLVVGLVVAIVPLCILYVVLFIYGWMPVDPSQVHLAEGEGDMKRTEAFAKAIEEHPEAFLSDEQVGTSMLYRATKFLAYRVACWFYAFETLGAENFPPKGQGALVISMHSTHNYDIFLHLTGMYVATGRVPRGMLHRVLFKLHPYCKYLGVIPGQRHTAKHLLQAGFLNCVLPGGSEEAMYGHENAYRLHPRWHDRRGFAHVAIEAGVDIIPIFMQNVEEMRFNPMFYACNKLGITRAFSRVVDMRIPAVSWALKQTGMCIWFVFAWVSLPIPVKVTLHIGKPVKVEQGQTADQVATRAREAMEALIAKHQPYGHSYGPGLKARLARMKQA